MRLKHSIGMLALNAERTIAWALEGVYQFASEIIVVEGQAGPEAAFMAGPEGQSLDDTVGAVLAFPDPANKICILHGQWLDKTDMANAFAREASGDWLWQIDSDEVADPEVLCEVDRRLATGDYDAVRMAWRHYWHDLYHVGAGSRWEEACLRAWRRSGSEWYFTDHWPPTVNGNAPEEARILDLRRDMGYLVDHLSYDDALEVERKMYYHAGRGLPLESWYRDCWLPYRCGEVPADSHPTGYMVAEPGRIAALDADGLGKTSPVVQRLRAVKPVRVLHVLPSMSGGGGARACYGPMELGPWTVQQKAVYLESCNVNGKVDVRGVEYHAADLLAPLLDWCDVVHVWWWRQLDDWWQVIAASDRPVVLDSVLAPRPGLCFAEWNRWGWEAKELDRASALVFVAHGALDVAYAEGLPKRDRDRAEIIHCCGDILPFAYHAGSPWRESEAPLIGFYGDFYSLKVPENLPEYLAAVHAAVPNARFQAVGEGPWLQQFQHRAAALGVPVEWLGWRSDMPRVLANWDIGLAVYPAVTTCASEASLQEMMAASVPTVVRTTPTLARFAGEAKAGIVLPVDAGSAEVAKAVAALANDPATRRAAGLRGKTYALRHLGASNALKKLVPLWSRLHEGKE